MDRIELLNALEARYDRAITGDDPFAGGIFVRCWDAICTIDVVSHNIKADDLFKWTKARNEIIRLYSGVPEFEMCFKNYGSYGGEN